MSLQHPDTELYDDASAVWAERSGDDYRACVIEMRQFSGLHSNLSVVSVLYLQYYKIFIEEIIVRNDFLPPSIISTPQLWMQVLVLDYE